MAVCLYIHAPWAPWYAGYVLVFNMLVGPVFSAGSITSERERQTLELLLCTTVSPWQILWGKLVSSLRISGVLTSFLIWPLLLAWLLPPWIYRSDSVAIVGYLAIIALTSLTTTTLGLFCSLIFRKTTTSMMTAYLVIMLLFAVPLAVLSLARTFFLDAPATAWIGQLTFTSPFAAAFNLPLTFGAVGASVPIVGNWPVFWGFMACYALVDLALLSSMLWLFDVRWRVRY
jgi:ABC-type transport system involved in multi-copper enzyme maturation permease subunit